MELAWPGKNNSSYVPRRVTGKILDSSLLPRELKDGTLDVVRYRCRVTPGEIWKSLFQPCLREIQVLIGQFLPLAPHTADKVVVSDLRSQYQEVAGARVVPHQEQPMDQDIHSIDSCTHANHLLSVNQAEIRKVRMPPNKKGASWPDQNELRFALRSRRE